MLGESGLRSCLDIYASNGGLRKGHVQRTNAQKGRSAVIESGFAVSANHRGGEEGEDDGAEGLHCN